MRSLQVLLLSGVALCSMQAPALAAADLDPKKLINMSLAELSNIEVTSVSKKSEKASEAAAAVFVVTADDIRRMGATSIPEALRGVPGVSVAQAGSHQWAVSVRGFNDQFANKLLVLIDGRSVYTPLFAGVWWDAQDVVLEDIERIEVIRGPGGTLWGANAVNGIINIITKKASDTQGALASATYGNQEWGGAVRYGAKLNETDHVRLYAKQNNRDEFKSLTTGDADDGWKKSQAGFRADGKISEVTEYTLQGDVYSIGEMLPWNLPSFTSPPTVYSNQEKNPHGGNVLGRVNYKNSPTSDMTLQLYYDRAVRDHVAYGVTNTFDIDFQHVWTGMSRNEIVWGLGYRLVDDNLRGSLYYTQTKLKRDDNIFSAFIQDKIAVVENEFFITLGSKFEHNDYTGFEIQPTARFTWLADDKQTLWGSVSRAVHTPNISTNDGTLALLYYPGPPFAGFITSQGNPFLDSETLTAYELGYRVQASDTVSLDSTVFYNSYKHLFGGRLGTASAVVTGPLAPYLLVPLEVYNGNSATSLGFELAANWDVTDYWKLSGSYSYINVKFDRVLPGFTFNGKEPQNQFAIRSTAYLPYNLELNNSLSYVADLPSIAVDGHLRLDVRLGWKATEGVELSLVGQNLLDPQHQEFSGFVYQSGAQVPRAVYGNITFRY